MALPRGAMGLSAVCDCVISLSYSLTIFCRAHIPNAEYQDLWPFGSREEYFKGFTLYGHDSHLGQVTINFKSY